MNDLLEELHFLLIYVKYFALFVRVLQCRAPHCVDKLTAGMEIPQAPLGCTCIHSHLNQHVCFLPQSHAVSVNKHEETHLHHPLNSSHNHARVCLNGRGFHRPPCPICYNLFFLLTFKSPVETPHHHCVSMGRHSLDSFLDPAFLMRDISTLAQLTGSMHKNGLGWGAAQQNCPTVLVQENSAQKDWVALSNFKICPLFSQLYLIQKHILVPGYL